MIEKYGRKGTEMNGIFFTEGEITQGKIISDAFAKSDQQNISIDKLKEKLANQAISLGANTVDRWKYVQKATIWSMSSTQWQMTGRFIKAEE